MSDTVKAIRFTYGTEALCGLLVLLGNAIAISAGSAEATGMALAALIVLPLAFIFLLTVVASIIALVKGGMHDRARICLWYVLIVIYFGLIALLNVLNVPASAYIALPFSAAVLILPVVWLSRTA